MTTSAPVSKTVLLIAALAVLASLASCETPPPPPPPPPAPVAEAPPPPPILLPRGVVELASVYQTYVQRAAAIDPQLHRRRQGGGLAEDGRAI
ncbi:MAG: hypothetical protein WDN45_02915 [Caulobacteraceae bacterium]